MSSGRRARLCGAVSALLVLSGCSSLFGDKKADYRSQPGATAPLEVPPDLTQLAREGRFRSSSSVVSAAASAAAPGAAVAVPAVAAVTAADARVERDAQQRWLFVARPPEQLWPLVRSFWTDAGFKLEVENAQTGVMETGWAEDRAKVPTDFIRSTLGRFIDGLYDSGLRDRFRTRLERTPAGTEIYISHRRLEEVYTSVTRDSTRWQSRPADPQMEAEFLSRLLARLSQQPEAAAKDQVARAAPGGVPTTVALPPGEAQLQLDDGFDRAWRRVGVALDRSGFSVEDRDRAAGLYFVRYVEPTASGKDEPGFLSRWFGGDKPTAIARYRVLVKTEGNRTTVSLQNQQGVTETGETARRILSQLAEGLR